ncbi:helicase-associated domain-containing protein [Actinomycetes bacterium KLBMP 9797]
MSLADYLSTLTPERLAAILDRRLDFRFLVPPRTLDLLARSLAHPHHAPVAVVVLNKAELQVAEALVFHGDGCTRADLAATLGVPVDDPGLERALAGLADHAVAWPAGDRLETIPLGEVWPRPFKLGRPALTLLQAQDAEFLREVARALGLRASGSKGALAAEIAAWLADHDNVHRLVADAPKPTQKVLTTHAWKGPIRLNPYGHQWQNLDLGPAQWAFERGLLVPSNQWELILEMPREVALALRGPDGRIPFDADPPALATTPVRGDVEREAAAAAATMVRRTTALLEECGRAPVAVLKNGGVGVRELRRLGKVIDDTPERARLWLELTYAAGLIAATSDGLVPTEMYDKWRLGDPATQAATLLGHWQAMDSAPLRAPGYDEQRQPALAQTRDDPILPILRDTVLRAATSLAPGVAIDGFETLVEYTTWHRPEIMAAVADADDLVASLWEEAVAVGAIALGAASGLGRALTAGDHSEVDKVAGALLPAAEETVLLQADLTAVVPGTPSARLVALLDGAADRESSGTAATWRFSSASVRRAFDGGVVADELLAALRDVAAGGRMPQPLEYLVKDVARRHGEVRVMPIACCLRSEDTALLNEIRHAKALAKLGLVALAPTVLGSAKSAAETLKALRTAGYAPAGENTDGTVALEPRQHHRAVPSQPAGPPEFLGLEAPTDTLTLARKLLTP